MNNKINHILTLEDGLKFLVINQVIFKGKNYYLTKQEKIPVGEA